MKNELNVLYACDENYAPFAGVSMTSLFMNNRDIEKIVVYLVLDQVSSENKSRYRQLAEEYGREVVLLDASEVVEKIKALNIPMYRGSYTTNFRLFFPEYIRPDVKKLLYLDCDTIVVGSLKPLLENVCGDMGENCMAMVYESVGVRRRKFILYSSMYNAGITMFDVENWKKGQWTDKLLYHIEHVRARYPSPDQDLLNVVCEGSILRLPPEYNSQPIHRVLPDDIYYREAPPTYYKPEELAYAHTHPVILHTYRFLGQFPWHKDSMHPDTERFDSYLKKSLWRDYEKKLSPQNLSYKIERILFRYLPAGMFFWVFNTAQEIVFRSLEKKMQKEEAQMRVKRTI